MARLSSSKTHRAAQDGLLYGSRITHRSRFSQTGKIHTRYATCIHRVAMKWAT